MNILVTGGAGFIGSHLARRLLGDRHRVRVLDDLSTGRMENLEAAGVEPMIGDIRRRDAVRAAMAGVQAVFHVAAMPSVVRSWDDPVGSIATNAIGTSIVVEEAERAGVESLIYSSSSSVYGDQPTDSKSEDLEPSPISPYGAGKLVGEKLVLSRHWPGTQRTLALRYFNVFGPGQDSGSPYSAVIPLVIGHALAGTTAVIYGDGLQSRDFTFVANVVEANLLALASDAGGMPVNIACGESHTLLELVDAVSRIHGSTVSVRHEASRKGDVRSSLADVGRAADLLGFKPCVLFEEGLRQTYDAYRQAGARE